MMYGDCPYDIRLGEVMTNYDHSIDRIVALELKRNEMWAAYAGANFNGAVWWDRTAESFKCQVWQYHVPGIIVTGSLEEIMKMVSSDFGGD